MEDYLIREIDKIGELLYAMACRLGLFKVVVPTISLDDLKKEFKASKLDIDIHQVLAHPTPVEYLVTERHFSDKSLELFTEMLHHSDINPHTLQLFLTSVVAYLDSKGYYSFLLHAMQT